MSKRRGKMTSQVRQCGLFTRLVLLFLALRRPMLPGVPCSSRVYRWRDPSLLRMCAFRLASQQTQAWKGEGMSQEDFMHKDECIVLDENDIVQGHANKYDCHRFNEKQVRPLLYPYRAAPICDIECLFFRLIAAEGYSAPRLQRLPLRQSEPAPSATARQVEDYFPRRVDEHMLLPPAFRLRAHRGGHTRRPPERLSSG